MACQDHNARSASRKSFSADDSGSAFVAAAGRDIAAAHDAGDHRLVESLFRLVARIEGMGTAA